MIIYKFPIILSSLHTASFIIYIISFRILTRYFIVSLKLYIFSDKMIGKKYLKIKYKIIIKQRYSLNRKFIEEKRQ